MLGTMCACPISMVATIRQSCAALSCLCGRQACRGGSRQSGRARGEAARLANHVHRAVCGRGQAGPHPMSGRRRARCAGRFGVIRSLLRVLEEGAAAKAVLDIVIDANSAMQNLREAIAGRSTPSDANSTLSTHFRRACMPELHKADTS